MSGGEGPKLPKPPNSWDAQAAMQHVLEKHVLRDAHRSEDAAFNAALGDLILSYLDSLPTKDRLEALLALKGPEGFREERLLADAEEGGRPNAGEDLFQAARDLREAGKLRRVRRTRSGEIFWVPAGPLITNHKE